jgi:hypothetical protein
MIDSYTATSVIVGFLVIFGVILPIFDKIPKLKDFVSLRWTIVVIYSAMCIGVIIDFNHLDTSVRFAVVVGGIVLSAIFLLVRSLEKAAVNKWRYPRIKGTIKRGDTQAEISLAEKSQMGISPLEKNSDKERAKEQYDERKHEENMKELSKFVLSQDQSGIDFDEKMNQAISVSMAKQQQRK